MKDHKKIDNVKEIYLTPKCASINLETLKLVYPNAKIEITHLIYMNMPFWSEEECDNVIYFVLNP